MGVVVVVVFFTQYVHSENIVFKAAFLYHLEKLNRIKGVVKRLYSDRMSFGPL